MIIELITTFYREEFLAPLFMLHYSPWCDRMTFITQQFPDGKFDDELKMNWINEALARSKADWVVLVDMDEFVYPDPYGTNPRSVLEKERMLGNRMIYSAMTRMWRHHSDKNIDRTIPPVPQRLHGIPDHVKPCIFDPTGVEMGAGNHDYRATDPRSSGTAWKGAHWANSDPCFWIDRETRDRGPRLSERNIARGHGTHTRRTREQILAECRAHENDPIIITL
jgi:hypothetical protein